MGIWSLAVNELGARRTDAVEGATDRDDPLGHQRQELEDEGNQEYKKYLHWNLPPHGLHCWWNEHAIAILIRPNPWPREPLQQGVVPSDAAVLDGDRESSALRRGQSRGQGPGPDLPQGVGPLLACSWVGYICGRVEKVRGWQGYCWLKFGRRVIQSGRIIHALPWCTNASWLGVAIHW